jgi:5-formyltetrahydrofolate cyclo-ligase
MPDKQNIRLHIKKLGENITQEEKLAQSARVWRLLEEKEIFRHAKVILMYWSMPDEVFTHDFILRWCEEKTVLLPVIKGDSLIAKHFIDVQLLKKNAELNVYEPQGSEYSHLRDIDLVVVPGIAFDREKRRLGRGKGYYDKFLPSLRAYKAGVCFDFQVLDNIPSDAHDVRMDEVIGL